MANKMLIDATHPEETRVVVTRGQRVEEFDFESASRRQLRGNIYLAKVTRVEPSLQAAFVEYGGNRHGFLAFSEIHPDYYQIPVADRLALLEDEARAEREFDEDGERPRSKRKSQARKSRSESSVSAEAGEENGQDHDHGDENGDGDDAVDEQDIVEQVGSGDALEELAERRRASRRQYKIQEVIKRRQILLVQVVKEERGNKGAALTTYLSLAGRYSVLMPNTARGGGISRKITNAVDRKRLKEVAHELEVPDGMGVILRTAGASRTKPEIKRDFEYLMRLWESVRELTLHSSAPKLVYEEGSLIKRAIRDLYNRDIDEIQVAGEDAYREAKDFMRMLMPSHAKVVKAYRETQPLFARFGIESQLDAMFQNQVTLKSGGYIVINPTEALVSIDVNSGRSTREHNIEDTALKTNLEAAEEVARQLRLRDLAGLIVIDFIDMEEKRNNRAVEKKMKDCLKNDRARIQVGRISPFGLLEMSRQRIRTGVLESSTMPCPHCGGTGLLRATPSVALHILRSLEEMLIKSATHDLIVRTRTEVALYILNHKRAHLAALEMRFGVAIHVYADDSHSGRSYFTLERGELSTRPEINLLPFLVAPPPGPTPEDEADEAVEDEVELEAETGSDEEEEAEAPVAREAREPREPREPRRERDENGDGGRRRRRRRRRRGRGADGRPEGVGENGEARPAGEFAPQSDDEGSEDDAAEGDAEATEAAAVNEDGARGDDAGRRRRRGRRGGRRMRGDEARDGTAGSEAEAAVAQVEARDDVTDAAVAPAPEATPAAKPKRSRRRTSDSAEAEAAPQASVVEAPAEAPAKPARGRRRKADAEPAAESAEVVATVEAVEAPAKPARRVRGRGAKAAETAPEPAASTAAAPKQRQVEAPASRAPASAAMAEEPVAEPPAPAPEAPAPQPPAEPVTMVLSQPDEDPNRPRRSGWWAKAKQVLSGQ
jgi:ribonuclease E